MKIAYCGYDFFLDCFLSLCENENIEVLEVFTYITDDVYNFNRNLISEAEQRHIPVHKDRITVENVCTLFEEKGCQCLIVAAYPYKIPIGNYRGINVHPTLLPIGRGPWPLPGIILKQKEESGVTIHKLIDEMDAGDILMQESFKIQPREDLETLSCRSQMLAKKMFHVLFENDEIFEMFWKNAYQQGTGEYWTFPSDDEMTFDGNMSVEEIDRIVRAYGKFDSCVSFDGKSWRIWDVNAWKEEHTYPCGTIVHKTNKEYLMAVKDGFVCFRFFQEELC